MSAQLKSALQGQTTWCVLVWIATCIGNLHFQMDGKMSGQPVQRLHETTRTILVTGPSATVTRRLMLAPGSTLTVVRTHGSAKVRLVDVQVNDPALEAVYT